MPLFSREVGPFQAAQRQNDTLKKSIDNSAKECDKFIKNIKAKNREEKLKTLFSSCVVLQKESEQHLTVIESLAENLEPKPIKDFEKKKSTEVEKIKAIQLKIEEVISSFPEKLREGTTEESEHEKEDKPDEVEAHGDGGEAAKVTTKAEQKKEEKKAKEDKKKEEKKAKEEKKNEDKKKKDEKEKVAKKVEIDDTINIAENTQDDIDDVSDDDEVKAETGEFTTGEFTGELTTGEFTATGDTAESEEEDDDDDDDEEEGEGGDESDFHDTEEEEVDEKMKKPVVAPTNESAPEPTPRVSSQTSLKEKPKDEVKVKDATERVSSQASLKEKPKDEMKTQGQITTNKLAEPSKTQDGEETEEGESEEESEEGDEDEDEDEEEDDVDEEEDEGETTTSLPSTMRQFKAIHDYTGNMDEDLSFQKGDVLTVVHTLKGDWWEAMNTKGKKGLVPRNFLKPHKTRTESQTKDDTDKDALNEEDDEEDEAVDVNDEVDVSDGDDDGHDGKKLTRSRSASDHWHELKRGVTETSLSEVLHAMGAVPSGFRPSTLAASIMTDPRHRMVHHLAPKLTPSNLSYADITLDINKNKIKAQPVRIERIVRIRFCKQIPGVGAGMEILSRHVRACLFDGEKILSNIHCVKVSAVDKTQKTWTFNSKVTESMDTQQHSDIFIRTNSSAENIGMLFELCVTCLRTSTGEMGEVSCGWVHVPLIDEATGQVILSKNYDIQVSGGTPYEDGVEVDPSISRRASSSVLVTMLAGNKQPMLSIRVINPSNEQRDLIQTLPETLIGNACLVQFYSFYRQLLADALIRDRLDLDSTECIHSAVLVNFPVAADEHDIMNVFRNAWIERQRQVRRSEKDANILMRDEEYMKDVFGQVFMETGYIIMNLSNLPSYHSLYLDSNRERNRIVQQFGMTKQTNSVVSILCSSEYTFTPFNMNEVSYSIVNEHCVRSPIHVDAS